MKKAQIKHEYFHRGVDNQKTPDLIVDLKRPTKEQMELWGLKSHLGLSQWVTDIRSSFEAYIKVIEEVIY